MQHLSKVKRALALPVALVGFVYMVGLMVTHAHWARCNIAFFDAWYQWYPALVLLILSLHLDGSFYPKK